MTATKTELEVLTESIGVCSAQYVGHDRLHSLSVELHHESMECIVTVELVNNNRENQVYAMKKLIELEKMYLGEVTMTFLFTEDEATGSEATHNASQRQFSFV
ncbi:hypothetical protein [Arthrobacter ruber]|uniref:hypothetical protein n=1 Tax=Arthrobacter ruber TaxID=1258893 RepID=UPI000CF37665|nr:hypothetical protein [Arthrobacter ruber]